MTSKVVIPNVNQSMRRNRGGTVTGVGGPPGAPARVMPPAAGLAGWPGLPPGCFVSIGFPSPSGLAEFFLLITYGIVLFVTSTGAAVERFWRSFVQLKVATGQMLFSTCEAANCGSRQADVLKLSDEEMKELCGPSPQ